MNAHKILIGKFVEKLPLRRPRRSCDDNINMDLMKICCEDKICMGLAQNPALCMILQLQYEVDFKGF
jgi:hypothetical protein